MYCFVYRRSLALRSAMGRLDVVEYELAVRSNRPNRNITLLERWPYGTIRLYSNRLVKMRNARWALITHDMNLIPDPFSVNYWPQINWTYVRRCVSNGQWPIGKTEHVAVSHDHRRITLESPSLWRRKQPVKPVSADYRRRAVGAFRIACAFTTVWWRFLFKEIRALDGRD